VSKDVIRHRTTYIQTHQLPRSYDTDDKTGISCMETVKSCSVFICVKGLINPQTNLLPNANHSHYLWRYLPGA
jgi:hypothetical protein